MIPLAFACLLLAYIEGVSAARTFAAKHGYPLDVRQELLGLGGANLLVAFGGGYPVAGGLSQSAVNEKAGAKTPLALVFASVTLGFCLVFLTGLVQNLPKAVLAAIVLVAVKGLIDVREMVRLWRVSRFDFIVAMVAFAGVLVLGILKGVLLAALVSILMLLHRAAHPHVAFLGRIPNTRRFSDLARHPDNQPIEGVLAFRVESSLLYFNAEHVLRAVLERLRGEGPTVRLVVCDLSTSPYVDLAGARMLASLSDELAKRRRRPAPRRSARGDARSAARRGGGRQGRRHRPLHVGGRRGGAFSASRTMIAARATWRIPEMARVLNEIRHTPVLWLLVFVPVVFVADADRPRGAYGAVPAVRPRHRAAGGVAQPGNGERGGEDGRHDRRIAQRDARQPDRAGHRADGVAPGDARAGQGIDRRCGRHQRAVHARRFVPARWSQVSRAGVQPRNGASASRPAAVGVRRAGRSVGAQRRRSRRGRVYAAVERWPLDPADHCLRTRLALLPGNTRETVRKRAARFSRTTKNRGRSARRSWRLPASRCWWRW